MINKNGVINVVGIGSGNLDDMTIRAYNTLKDSEIIIGYSTYINQIKRLFENKIYESNGMKKEIERCKICIEYAQKGKNVSIISSGDSGIYGMAGIILEIVPDYIKVNIVSGVTSSILAASKLGAPLMNDFSVISMSDIMTPIEKIMKRIEGAAYSDMVICIYNPRSSKRTEGIINAFGIIKKIQGENICVGIIKDAGRENEKIILTTTGKINFEQLDMNSIVIVGNSDTVIKNGRMITKRGYRI